MNQETAEKIAEQFGDKGVRGGGGGGRKYPKERFGRDSRAKVEHMKAEAKNKNRELLEAQRQVGERLSIVLSRETNPTSHLAVREYLEWVRYGLLAFQEDPGEVIKDGDLKLEFTRSSGPGGQNVNKVSTAIRIFHKPSQIKLKEEGSSSQEGNRDRALERMKEKLVGHLESWVRVVGSRDAGEVLAEKLVEVISKKQLRSREGEVLADIVSKLKEHRNLV